MADRVRCPVCEERFDLDSGLEAGDTTYCPACSTELRILKLHPVEVEEISNPWDEYQDDADYDNEDNYEVKPRGGEWS